MTTTRPCRYCIANWAGVTTRNGGTVILPEPADCEMTHRDDPRVYDLAAAYARAIHETDPTDEQISWFLGDADDVIDDFNPAPGRWTVQRLPSGDEDGFRGIDARMQINGEPYVALEGGKDSRGQVVRLSVFEGWHRHLSECSMLNYPGMECDCDDDSPEWTI